MNINVERLRKQLHAFDFRKLFINELGWDKANTDITVQVDGQDYCLQAVAQKRGLMVFHCPAPAGQSLPDYATRRKIDAKTRKTFHEHLIIFTDPANTQQKWQWVRREPGKPSAGREIGFGLGQSGEALIQRLQTLAFSLEEEEGLTIVDVTSRVRAGFDLERVTKRFYDRFKTEHTAFLKFLQGIPDEDLQRWYVSVTLNRLMFVYFIQWKDFLDGDQHYLRNRLERTRQHLGEDRFYRDFLCPLFFEGFAQKERTPQVRALLGNVPYLNGGIFQRHQLEERFGQAIQIPDAAFTRLFDFFDGYNWHLDERPLRDDREINPDVLGFIFEKYINQKQMGAYYTKEDITGYISKYTILPALFERTRKDCRIAFEGESAVWKYLAAEPERYIYPAMLKGLELPLPENIASGINDVALRGDWNRSADDAYALPTEIWRETVARRQRAEDVRARLATGEVRDINDLITYNLDIQQFAQDVIEGSEGPELVRAFWKALVDIKVLDPTCGSGAFLFAALNILEPLYEACLDRMQSFVDELEAGIARGEKHHPEKFSDFRKTLTQVTRHHNRSYFIFKSIIVNNLYGVDIMEEAVEICKLRLFLKLIAQVGSVQHIEPLPDIDFNVRPGNTLIGFTTREEVRRALTSQGQQATLGLFGESEAADRVEEQAELADKAFQRFRQMQTEEEIDSEVFRSAKIELKERLRKLYDELNKAQAIQYLASPLQHDAYVKWLNSYQPFHWFIDFYGIMKNGGFDVIIGNPPYVEYSNVRSQYQIRDFDSENCGNLFSYVMERSINLCKGKSRFGMIVPLSAFCSQRMKPIIDFTLKKSSHLWISNYGWRPSKLFDGVNLRLSICLLEKGVSSSTPVVYTTRYLKWNSDARRTLFNGLEYVENPLVGESDVIAKVQTKIENEIYQKLIRQKGKIEVLSSSYSEFLLYYKNTGVNHWITVTQVPPKTFRDGKPDKSTRETTLRVTNKTSRDFLICCLNSDLFFWFYTIRTNCRDLNPNDIKSFPIPSNIENDPIWELLAPELMESLDQNSSYIVRNQKLTGEIKIQSFKPRFSKAIIERIDDVLGEYYGLDATELDLIKSYDIKFRTGVDEGEDEE